MELERAIEQMKRRKVGRPTQLVCEIIHTTGQAEQVMGEDINMNIGNGVSRESWQLLNVDWRWKTKFIISGMSALCMGNKCLVNIVHL